VHVYNSSPIVFTFTTIQCYQRPDSFSAFIRSVSSAVRLIWGITQIEDISLVHTSNSDYVNIKTATWHHSEARLVYTSIVQLTLLFLFFSGITQPSAHAHPNAETAYSAVNFDLRRQIDNYTLYYNYLFYWLPVFLDIQTVHFWISSGFFGDRLQADAKDLK